MKHQNLIRKCGLLLQFLPNEQLTVANRFIRNLIPNSIKQILIHIFLFSHVLNLKIQTNIYIIIRGLDNNKISKNKIYEKKNIHRNNF
jgi:hypothetical protein